MSVPQPVSGQESINLTWGMDMDYLQGSAVPAQSHARNSRASANMIVFQW